MDTDSTVMIVIMILLTACSAFFSATETAYLSLSQPKIKTLASSGERRAQLVLRLYEDYDRLISTVLIGNNIVNITLSSISTVLFIKFFAGLGATISTVVVTVVVLVFGEITPKTVSRDYAESFTMNTVYVLRAITFILYPFSVVFGLWQKLIDKITVPPEDDSVTEEEIITMVDEAEVGGSIDEDEGKLIRSAIGFTDITADEILTPRSDVVYVSEDASNDDISAAFMESGFSRLPVCGENLDDVKGILHEKDFLYYTKTPGTTLTSILTKPVFVSKHIGIYELLKIMQNAKCHMAIVSDEFGSLCGIVTLEDIIEELIGEIWDEHDKVEIDFTEEADGSLTVDCSAEADALFEHFGIEPDDDEQTDQAQTVNGWLINCFGYIPSVGESIDADGLHVLIDSVDQTKILKAKVTKFTIPSED